MKSTNELLSEVCSERRSVDTETLEQVVTLAVELAREGREGRKIGAIFMVGDDDAVMACSRPMILDPLYGHSDEMKRIRDADMRETMKELAQLDGAFVISDDGVAISAARYLDAHSTGVEVPLGLGSRHMAAAAVSQQTRAVGVVVSQSAVVRIFDDGELVAEILPELWMMSQYSSHIEAPIFTRSDEQVAVLSKAE